MRNPEDILVNGKQLSVILENHKKWLLSQEGGERADLRGADLHGADLQGADLQGAYLQGAYLRGAYLQGAYLRGAYLRGAYLRGADLRGAYLQGADLQDADLQGALNADFLLATTYIVPESGAFVGYKKCNDGIIVKLQIPAKAKRSNATGRKCRAEYVKVLYVYGADFGITDSYGPRTEYKKGETVYCHEWDDNRFNECSGGIHFFITRIEAENY